MSLKKNGVVVSCEHCACVSDDELANFDVIVPLSDTDTGLQGTARLACSVSSREHRVDLKEWKDTTGVPVQVSDIVKARVRKALDFVADRRICGNRHICPSKVVDIVERHSRG